MEIKEQALKIAASQVGTREVKNTNTGLAVNAYLKSVGLPPGYPWCMAFVYWCYQLAAAQLRVKNPLIKTGGVLSEWGTIDEKYKVIPSSALNDNSLVKPGSVFVMDHGSGQGHAGIVEKIYGDMIETIEGNSNNNGSREGVAVVRHSRKINTIKGFMVINL